MFPFKSLRYPTPEQSKIWFRRKQGKAPSAIATEMGVSRPYVSQAQRIAERRIEGLLRHMASANRIDLKHISPQHGIAVGECPALNTTVYFTYTSAMGVQTWYRHQGDCKKCNMIASCNEILKTLSKEWGIKIPKDKAPTEVGVQLFDKIMEELGWTK